MPADHTPTDETVLRQPAGPISPQEIAEMWERWARVVGDVPVGALDKSDRGERLGHLIGSDMYRLLDAIEALTAENARLTSERDELARRARMSADMIAACDQDTLMQDAAADEMTAQIAALKAEVERQRNVILKAYRLVSMGHDFAVTDAAYWLERNLPGEVGAKQRSWYATHRAKVEADHAAAMQAKRQAECRPDAAKAGGIDIALLGDLCREEPDEAAKREVAEMMDGIKAMDGSPSILCHPEWPKLMAEALAQVKAGD